MKEGEYHWYVFRFEQEKDKVMQPVEIRLYSELLEGAVLTVRNEDQAELWRQSGEQQHFGAGQVQWYIFRFEYDEGVTGSVEIKLYGEPWNAAVLTVRSEAQAEAWRQEGVEQHFGCCTGVNVDKNSDGVPDYLLWAGSLRSTGTDYAVVEHARDVSGPVHYRFTISGKGLSFPNAPYMPPPAKAAAPAVAKPASKALTGMEGSGPDNILKPTDAWYELKEGQYHWHAFQFKFESGKMMRPVEIRLYAEPLEGAVLTVRNEEQADLWRKQGKAEHVGCCTTVDVDKNNDGKADYTLWAGNLGSTDKYYIVVEHAKDVSGPVYYSFTITGDGVSFP